MKVVVAGVAATKAVFELFCFNWLRPIWKPMLAQFCFDDIDNGATSACYESASRPPQAHASHQ